MNKPFMRRRELKGFKDYKALDNYIQNCLDSYKIMSPLQEYYDISGKYAKYIISNKSTVPDLVIYNSKFNKNDCFYDYYGKNYNVFPRVTFVLNSKTSKNKIKKKKEDINFSPKDKTKIVKNDEKENDENKKEINAENKNEIKEENKDKKEEIKNENEENKNEMNKEEIKNKNENENEEIKNDFEEKQEKEKEEIKTENEKVKKEEEEKSNEDKEELNEDEKDDMNDEDDDLTNPTQFFAQIQSNKEKLTKEPSNNNINEIDEEEELKKESEKNTLMIKKEEIKEIEKKEELKEEKKQTPKKNILINPKTQNNIIEAETESLTFIETKKPKNENSQNQNNQNFQNLNQQNNNNNNNNQNDKPKIQMINPQMNIPMINPLMYMQNPFMTNPTLSVPFNYTMMNHMNYMNFQNDDDDEEDDPMLNNFNDDFSKYNPSIFLEKPALIVKKNLFDKNWILMRNNKVVFNFNSEELFYYLGEQIRYGNKFENISICDFQTDLFFMPSNLFDILRNTVPKLKKLYLQQKMMEYNLNKNQMFMMNNQMMMNNNSKFNSGKK